MRFYPHDQNCKKIMIENNQRLSPSEAAAYLGFKESTLASWRCTNKQKIPYDSFFLELVSQDIYKNLKRAGNESWSGQK